MVKTVRRPTISAKPHHYLKEWRQHRNLTQEELAARIHKTHGAISQLERGLTGYTQDTLEAIASTLHVEPGDLLSVDPSKKQKR